MPTHENYIIDFLHERIFCITWSLIAPFQFLIYNNKQKTKPKEILAQFYTISQQHEHN
jgi:hypothetical protein